MPHDGAALLACAVLEQALTDLASADRRIRDSAARFLTAPDRHEDRAFWCALAGVDDAALVATVRAEWRDVRDAGPAVVEAATSDAPCV